MTDSNNNRYYLHYDQVGTLKAVSDTNQNIIKEITYDTYGNILTDSNPNLNVPFGFAGGLYDSDTKLVHFGYREYDPFTGKWSAKDPLLFGGGDSNLYGYVLGDPVNLVDPLGLTSLYVDIKNGTMYIRPKDGSPEYYTMPVTSGRDNCTNQPTCDSKPNIGPIPSGNYYANANDLTNPGIIGDVLRNMRGDWGDWRVPLKPGKGTNTHGRNGFFLHGGSLSGSAGCIDFGGGLFGNSNTDKLLRDLLNDPDGIIPVIVF
jgi:RHS repeat-associated protein